MNSQPERIRVTRANKNVCPAEWVLDSDKVAWTDFTLWLIRHGSGHVETSGASVDFREGACLLFRPDEHYRVRGNTGDRPVLAISVHFVHLDEENNVIVPPAESRPRLHRQVSPLVFLWEILERCVTAGHLRTPAGQHEADLWLRAALTEIANQDSRPQYRGLEKEHAELVGHLCARIMENPGAHHTVDQMAKDFGASRYHFSRVFKKLKGMTPREFVVDARIEAAKALLRGSSHPIRQIAALLGYSDTYFFSRQFRKKTGIPPSVFRKQ